MSKLFETTTINTMILKNRFVRSATWMGMAGEDGSCSQRLIDLMEKLAHGNVGLIIWEPDLIKRWKSGDIREADCVSDNACFQPGIQGKGVQCVHVEN